MATRKPKLPTSEELKKKLRVPELPAGIYRNAVVHRAYGKMGRLYTFIILESNEIFVVGLHGGLNLYSSSNVNDDVRRVYCNLANIKLKDLKADIKRAKTFEANEITSSKFRDLSNQASKAGYRLVKTNP